MIHDNLGIRMKEYEAISQNKLIKRLPAIIRIDGKCAHSFCKHLIKPYDKIFNTAMQNMMKHICQEIQGVIFGYTQSDECSILLQSWETLETDAWFDNKVQKLTSVSASMATLYFNQEFNKLAQEEIFNWQHSLTSQSMELQLKVKKYHDALKNCMMNGLLFDARCFNLPFEEVVNYFYWREQDAIRNSIQSAGQANFSHKQLMNKNTKQVCEMLTEIGKSWEDLPIAQQRGVACIKDENGWYIDYNMPILKNEGRDYLEKLI